MADQPATAKDYFWRAAYRLAYPFMKFWWRVSGARHAGALAAIYVGDALLLLKASYRPGWNFPGGGIDSGETPEAAVRRELREEIGLEAATMTPAGEVSGIFNGRREMIYFFEMRLEHLPDLRLDNREIIAARLVTPDELPRIKLTGPVAAYLAGRQNRA